MDIFIDIDGVLANWTKSVAFINGVVYQRNKIYRSYELDTQIGRELIDKAMYTPGFWLNLEKFPWSDELVHLVDITCPTWRFLTKANNDAQCYGNKAVWLENAYPQYVERLVICRGEKTFACKPGDILIDDHPTNVKEWNNAGGQGYHWLEMGDEFDYHPQMNNLRKFLLEKYNSTS